MKKYKDIDSDSGVIAYEFGEDYIKVKFSTGAIYMYSYLISGSNNVEHMKKLAIKGDGLNAFINTTIRKMYVRE